MPGDSKTFVFLVAMTNGMAIFVLAMAMENVSGGHMNPVVSFVAVCQISRRADFAAKIKIKHG
jgi:glycerol uptake facilitator-like aquaporin